MLWRINEHSLEISIVVAKEDFTAICAHEQMVIDPRMCGVICRKTTLILFCQTVVSLYELAIFEANSIVLETIKAENE